MNIKDTPVYKYNAPMIRKQDREEFARMLELAIDANRFGHWACPSSKYLICAFSWSDSPQGQEYWQELYYRMEEYLS